MSRFVRISIFSRLLQQSFFYFQQNESALLNETESEDNKSASVSLSSTMFTTTDFYDRTLRDTRNVNANSTPMIGNDIRKLRDDIENTPALPLSEISVNFNSLKFSHD